jgi:hypothetical protein
MAGSDPRFDPARFRNAIHFAMSMAQPSSVDDQLVFSWQDRREFDPGDRESLPFDWTDAPDTTISYGPVTLLAAYEFHYGRVEDTVVGQFDEPTLAVTLLDTEYVQIFDTFGVRADTVQLPDKQTFEILFSAPPIALFDVTVYTIYARAVDVS